MPSVLDPLAHNVKYIFLFTLAYWSASSLISQQVLSGYIFETQSVGILRGLQGLTQLVVALPAGYAADHLRRDRVLKFAGGLGIATSLVTAFAFQIGCLPLMYVAFAMWGAFTAFQSPAMEALFADSLPAGQRSMPFTVKLVARSAALVVGPACAILLLLYNGDKWELPVVRPVLLCGSFAAMLSMGILFLFNDDEAYERQQHQLAVERQLRSIERNFDAEVSDYTVADVLVVSGRDRGETSYSEAQSRGPSEISKLIAAPSRTNVNKNAYNTNTMADESAVNSDAGGAARAKSTVPVFCGLDPTHVPPVLFVADFLVSNGTGMAMSVFPLFFANELGLAPIGIQWLFVAQPLCVGLGSILSQLLSRHLGRMPVIAATRAIGTVSVLLMAQPTGIHFHAQCFLFLLSTAMTNCSEPLRRSLLMDLVPRTQRARWNSLEGLSTGSWAGSAVLGGLLVETHGTRFCLVATSLLYAVGVALELLLIPLTRFAVETYATPSPASTAIQLMG